MHVAAKIRNLGIQWLYVFKHNVCVHRGEETMWDVFMDQFEVLATKAPVMLVAGNHERDFPDTGDRYGTGIDSGQTKLPQSLCSLSD